MAKPRLIPLHRGASIVQEPIDLLLVVDLPHGRFRNERDARAHVMREWQRFLDAEHPGVDVQEDTLTIRNVGDITTEVEHDEYVAVDVRGGLFPYVYRFERRQWTEQRIVGSRIMVSAAAYPETIEAVWERTAHT